MFRVTALALALTATFPLASQAFERIRDRSTFVNTVGGKDLKIALYGLH